MKTIKKDLILKKDTVFNKSIKVYGNIKGNYNLKVKGDIDCNDIDCHDIDCYNLDCDKLNFYAYAIAYRSFKCKSWKARRKNHIIKCLDREIEIKDGNKEFVLSEKRKQLLRDWMHPIEDACEREALKQFFDDIEEQDKEFIKRVLEVWTEVPDDDFPDAVKKLAGKELIEDGK